MNKRLTYIVLSLFIPSLALAREEIRVVGSSTVFPFAAAAAEQFGRQGKFRTPIVESTGTGGGFKMFCGGIGEQYPDLSDASRTIKPSEEAQCVKNGVGHVTEIALGYDGIVMASSTKTDIAYPLSRKILFLALARKVPVGGKLADNPYTRWRQLDTALPDIPIHVYGRPPSSGTRDAFSELVMDVGCDQVPEMKTLIPDPETRKKQCAQMREDGAYIEAGDDNNLIVQKLSANPEALGLFGYSFLESNAALVRAHPIEGVMPTEEAIVARRYPIARKLYIYVKDAHIGKVPGLHEFVRELTSDTASGPDGYLTMKGLLPLPEADHDAMKKVAAGLK